MQGSHKYTTIARRSRGEYKDRGSRFIAFALPVDTVRQADEAIEGIRREYHDARHHCYAYRLGWDYSRYRINDDGEPSGSAGRPVYGQIRSYGLTNILVVVVRYFGGTRLGVRGLINAYRGAAKNALENNSIVSRSLKVKLHLHFTYARMSEVMKLIKTHDLMPLRTNFELECDIVIAVEKNKSEAIQDKFRLIEGVSVRAGEIF